MLPSNDIQNSFAIDEADLEDDIEWTLPLVQRTAAELKQREEAGLGVTTRRRDQKHPGWSNPLNSSKEPKFLKNADRFRYDYVIVFPSPETATAPGYIPENETAAQKEAREAGERERQATREQIVADIAKAGLKLELFYSRDKDEIFCKIGATETRLREEADRVDYLVQLLENRDLGGVFTAFYDKRDEDVKESKEDDSASALRDNGKKPLWGLVKYYRMTDAHGEKYVSLFRNKDRFRLIHSILEAPKSWNGANFNAEENISKGHLKEAYYLHDAHEQKRLRLNENWANWRRILWYQPVDAVRFYFGEDISLYFAWLGFYVEMLKLPALFGFIVFWLSVALDRTDESFKVVLTLFAFFMALWASFFLEFWKRRNALYVVRWGTSNFEDTEHDRYQFTGTLKPSPITGEEEKTFPFIQRLKRLIFSWATIITFIFAVVIAILGIFVLRILLDEFSLGWVTGIINGVLILIFNQIYARIAVWLNNLENHRTNTAYRDHLIAKTFLFQFVNSYNSMFFIAFVKTFQVNFFGETHICLPKDKKNNVPFTENPLTGQFNDGEGPPDCMEELRIQLFAIFGTSLVVNNAMEILKPMLAAKIEARLEEKAVKDTELEPLDPISTEGQSKRPAYEGVLDDYAELVVQYGYVTLFVAAFPLAPVLAFLNNLAEIRVDAIKILQLSQRPYPSAAQDIGTWYYVLEIMSFMAVLTNMGLLMFTSNSMDFIYKDNESGKIWTFIISCGLIFLLKVIIDAAVPDHPEEADILIKRQEYIIEKYVYGLQDVDVKGKEGAAAEAHRLLEHIPDHEPTPYELEIGTSSLLKVKPDAQAEDGSQTVDTSLPPPDIEMQS